jgi:hypothetical protein
LLPLKHCDGTVPSGSSARKMMICSIELGLSLASALAMA